MVFAKGDSSLPFEEAGRAAAFDGHAERFRRMLIRELYRAVEFAGKRGDAHFQRDFVAAGAVGRKLLRSGKAPREERGIGEGLPNFFARRRHQRRPVNFHLRLPLDFAAAEFFAGRFAAEVFAPEDFGGAALALDGNGADGAAVRARSSAAEMARAANTDAMARRYSADAKMSASGSTPCAALAHAAEVSSALGVFPRSAFSTAVARYAFVPTPVMPSAMSSIFPLLETMTRAAAPTVANPDAG